MSKNDDKSTDPKNQGGSAAATAPQAAATALEAVVSEPAEERPNLTRQSLEQTLAARFELEGKSREEAARLAKKRAREMCA